MAFAIFLDERLAIKLLKLITILDMRMTILVQSFDSYFSVLKRLIICLWFRLYHSSMAGVVSEVETIAIKLLK